MNMDLDLDMDIDRRITQAYKSMPTPVTHYTLRYHKLQHTICLVLMVSHDITQRYTLKYTPGAIHLLFQKIASHSPSDPRLPLFTISEEITPEFKFRSKVKSLLKNQLKLKKKYVHKIKFMHTQHKYFHTFLVVLKNKCLFPTCIGGIK